MIGHSTSHEGYGSQAIPGSVAHKQSVPAWLIVLGVVSTILGAVLRIAGARGDLWLDEITSVRSLSGLQHPWQVFYLGVSDNTHFLNSLYLYFCRPSIDPLRLRGLSILCSTLAIPVAGMVLWRPGRNKAAAAVAMVSFSVTFPMVYYGSEARGYAGLELFSLLLIYIAGGRFSEPSRGVLLGLCTLTGALFHSLTLVFLAGQIMTKFLLQWHQGKSLFSSALQSANFFKIPIIVSVTFLLYIFIIHSYFNYKIELYEETTLKMFAYNYIPLTYHLFTTSTNKINIFMMTIQFFLCYYIVFYCLNKKLDYSCLCIVNIVLIPIIFLILRVPCLYSPRYFFLTWICILILYSAWVSYISKKSKYIEILAILTGMFAFERNISADLTLEHIGRGHYAQLVDSMQEPGVATYSVSQRRLQPPVIEYFANIQNIRVKKIDNTKWCTSEPEWFVTAFPPFSDIMSFGPDKCQTEFRKIRVFRAVGFGVSDWALYRNASGGTPPTQSR